MSSTDTTNTSGENTVPATSYATIDIYEKAAENIFLYSAPVSDDAIKVQGYDFNNGVDFHAMMDTFKSSGFQATNLYEAMEVIKQMLEAREKTPGFKLYLGYTSNQISCGNREVIRFLVEHNLVDAIVTSAGGIEEDFIKCLAPTVVGDFHLDGRMLRKKGLNRIGNLIMPNNNYCDFEDFLMPILDECLAKQQKEGYLWTPSRLIRFLGEKINNESSVYYWAAKHNIPVYCPAITDGSIGDMLYFHDIKRGGFVLDIVQDIRQLNESAVRASMTGAFLLGGGTMKHHILNANMMRNGCDFAVYINTGLEYDGSDSGAAPEEALSWGKIKSTAKPVKVHMEASIALPLIVAHTFAPHVYAKQATLKKTETEEKSGTA